MIQNANLNYTEREIHPVNGWLNLILAIGGYILAFVLFAASFAVPYYGFANFLRIITFIYFFIGWFFFLGLKTVRPNEALVLTLFGKYYGTIKQEGFYRVNPFCSAVYPGRNVSQVTAENVNAGSTSATQVTSTTTSYRRTVSLKAQVLDNNKQKINDERGNPIEVGIVVTWQVIDTAKAVFNVDNYQQFVEVQADSALRDVVRCYPYDDYEDHTISLRGESSEVSERIQEELQKRVEIAGIRILDARITHLAYAPEIAGAMLQRQQAEAVIEARQKIVDGAVGMVEMALKKLSENNVVELDDERKAQMVSNLLVVLCGNKDAQPIVNSGSIY
ncbi:MAG: SPFH domain-containing protein [Oscillospiraceae bacterium]|nr:SPFH domain-containing protein [Oscillospiraceae bacterium]MDO5138350.1 SPFH domain-containing protein [Oscillospiraceae bacterium]